MTLLHQTLALFGGVGGALLAATAVTHMLARRVPAGQRSPAIENLKARVSAWWAMVALIGLAFLFGNAGVIGLFALASFAALREFVTLTPTRRGDHWPLLVGFFIVVPIQYGLIVADWYALYSIFIPVYAFLVLPIAAAIRSETSQFLQRVAMVQWGLMICVFCLSHVPALLMLDIPGFAGCNILLVAFLILVVQSSDVLQFVWGKLFGHRPIAPVLSPSKTVEGFAGGCLSATILGGALWWITPFTPWQAALIAGVIALMGFLGGLVMSAIKRDRGVKDWGHLIPGHGGILDRLDSTIFAAPIFFHMTRYWWSS